MSRTEIVLATMKDSQGRVFSAYTGSRLVFEVRGSEACTAALKLLGVDIDSIPAAFFKGDMSLYQTQYLPGI